ncbi:MAG: histone deacetylase family protein [Bdellovibrionales bacterium]
MTTALYTHPACLGHDNGPGHPECPDRLAYILSELEKPEYAQLVRCEAPRAEIAQILRVHDGSYIDTIFGHVPRAGLHPLDHETSLSPGSGEAALRAAGALCRAIDDVIGGKSKNAFCAVRPPGHHAAVPPASGFCLFNNIAIGAAQALELYGLKRIAIVDCDVHHGNGTEAWAVTQPNVLFFSSHQFPLWPGSGRVQDKGPLGNIVNIPLSPGTGGEGFRQAMMQHVVAKMDSYAPELILISAGFDAHRDDPLAGLDLVEEDFGWITRELCALAEKHCGGRVVSTLEGGYNLEALAASTGAHVKALMAA